MNYQDLDPPMISWSRLDIEQKLFFSGGRHTATNNLCTGLTALLGTTCLYLVLIPFSTSSIAETFTQRGPTPYAITFLFTWSSAILLVKAKKLALQKTLLKSEITPSSHEFILSTANVDIVLDRAYSLVDDPRQFILINRIVAALSNLRNLGRVTDVDEILRSQAELDESALETSYSLLAGFVWAIPVLGFIGTVLGLSSAMGNFGSVLKGPEGIRGIKDALGAVTAGLSTAFETTLVALVAALIIQLAMTFMKKAEQEFLDHCTDYCTRNIVARLRVMPFEPEDTV